MNRTLYLNMYQKAFIYILLIISLSACTPKNKHYVIGVSQCSEDIWRDKLNDELSISSFSKRDLRICSISCYYTINLLYYIYTILKIKLIIMFKDFIYRKSSFNR